MTSQIKQDRFSKVLKIYMLKLQCSPSFIGIPEIAAFDIL